MLALSLCLSYDDACWLRHKNKRGIRDRSNGTWPREEKSPLRELSAARQGGAPKIPCNARLALVPPTALRCFTQCEIRSWGLSFRDITGCQLRNTSSPNKHPLLIQTRYPMSRSRRREEQPRHGQQSKGVSQPFHAPVKKRLHLQPGIRCQPTRVPLPVKSRTVVSSKLKLGPPLGVIACQEQSSHNGRCILRCDRSLVFPQICLLLDATQNPAPWHCCCCYASQMPVAKP
ncbi:hypothetical protein ACQKWADRAFT_300063 [Trichoderma austrokoningii]